jgi:hypothetical protein
MKRVTPAHARPAAAALCCVLAAACSRDPGTQTKTRQSAITCTPMYPGDPSCPDLPPGLSFVDDAASFVPIANETTADLVARRVDADGRRTIAYREGAAETPLFSAGYPIYAQGIKVGTGTVVCSGVAPAVSDLTTATLYCRATSGGAWSDAVDLGARAWLTDLEVDPADADAAIITYKIFETSPMDMSPAGLDQSITCERRRWSAAGFGGAQPCTTPNLAGTPCDDNDRCTTNDRWVDDGVCRGDYVVINGCSDPSECEYDVSQCPPAPEPGTACNDGNPDTTNDKIQGDGQCVGDL